MNLINEEIILKEAIIKKLNIIIAEELGINSKVSLLSDYIIREIKKSVINTKTSPSNLEDISIKENKIEVNGFENPITIVYKCFIYKDENSYKMNHQRMVQYFISSKTIYDTIHLNIECVGGYFMPQTLDDTIYHEIEHIFQKKMMGKSFGGKELYKRALRLKRIKDEYANAIGNIIYLSRKFEQDAYVNGLYGLLKTEKDVNYCLNNSDVYNGLLQLKKDYDLLLNSNENDISPWINIISDLGYDKNKLLNEANRAIKNIYRKIGRVIAKYNNDMLKNENIHLHQDYNNGKPYKLRH